MQTRLMRWRWNFAALRLAEAGNDRSSTIPNALRLNSGITDKRCQQSQISLSIRRRRYSQKLSCRLITLNGATMPTVKSILQTKATHHNFPIPASQLGQLATSLQEMLLRIGAVSTITGLSVPTIYRMMSQGGFPRPLKITSHARAWKLSDINAWIDSRELGGAS